MTDINKLTGEKYNSEKRKEIISSAYHIRGAFYQPRTKKELIEAIVTSGYWKDTKSKLQSMERPQIRGIFISIRLKQQVDFMRKI